MEQKPLLFILEFLLVPFAVIVFINTLCCVLTSDYYPFKIIPMFDQSFSQGAGDLRTVSLYKWFMSLICIRQLTLMVPVLWRLRGGDLQSVQEGDRGMAPAGSPGDWKPNF